jgi:hypothetical protein
MPLSILELGKQFRPATSNVYPPFKNGRYLEEYVYDVLMSNKNNISTSLVYIPIYWTNLQTHPGFQKMRNDYNYLLQAAIKAYPSDTPSDVTYFTIVQHDDGPQLSLPANTIIFGACTGTIPIPLLYEDTTNRLSRTEQFNKRDLLASFVGTYSTHPIRRDMKLVLEDKGDVVLGGRNIWSSKVNSNDADNFVELTIRSKFCLAPRGYGRSSFRFFEAILLDSIPVYIWDDIEWLPYKDVIDYSKISVSIQKNDIASLYEKLCGITDEEYSCMKDALCMAKSYFTLEYLVEYIIKCIK